MLLWLGAAAFAIAGVLGSFALLNASLYSASSFVARYLQAVADDDVASVLHTPGVRTASLPDVSEALLRPGVISAGPSQTRIVAEEARSAGQRLVTVDYQLGSESYSSRFLLRPIPAMFGLIQRWEFVESPLQLVTVTVNHGADFTAGTVTLDTRANKTGDELEAFSNSAEYLAIAPAQLQIAYRSELLTAEPVTVDVTPGDAASVAIDVLPSDELIDRVQRELDDFLAECATQRVLQPAGCPFGAEINDRVTSEPKWTIVATPPVSLTPGADSFEMPPTPAVARLTVDVQTLKDGIAETIDRDEEFTVALRVRVLDNQSISIELD